MAETYLAQAIAATNEGSFYDTNVKYLLADRQILARILKYAVSEFQDMEVGEIMSCIGDDIEVGRRPVDPGLSNLGRVAGAATEDSVPGEGTATYDIRFTAYHKGREMKFLLNVEAQKSSSPGALGYHLEYRILFYLARMVSAQKHTEFFHDDYDSLKNVRSIWICMDGGVDRDAIEEISLVRRTVYGKEREVEPRELGLMKGIIIHIRGGKGLKESRNRLIAMLEALFSQRSVEEKKRILTERHGMRMTEELEGRMQAMCNLSEALTETLAEELSETFLEQGREQERANTERERQRADKESRRADQAEAELRRVMKEMESYKRDGKR